MPADLTTTAYAILGHLAMRPWTMYELAAQMRRNVHYFYPRAESQVYAEPKRLVALGLARSKTVATGRRKRTVYEITPAGRSALRAWLAAPVTKGPLLEFEGLLRVFFAPFASDDDLKATLARVRDEVGTLLRLSAAIRTEYLAGRAPFQEYAPSRAMIHDFLTHFAVLVDSWATRSLSAAEAWAGTSEEERAAAAVDTFRRNALDRLSPRLTVDGAPNPAEDAEAPVRPKATARRRPRATRG